MHKLTVLKKNDSEKCPIRDVIDRIGDKWSLLILMFLSEDPARFNHIKKTIGDISQKVLARTLRMLEYEGYITRTVFDERPLKVVYQLTEIGQSVLTPINILVEWANKHHEHIRKHRRKNRGKIGIN